ncbi:MAG: hypothetical protein IKA79_07615 [Lentisphaeria bacterium]|nr:hypothetical protein [Lentisphaeria bacterium]
MLKKIFLIICTIFLPVLLSGCALIDWCGDYMGRNDPVPDAPPYTEKTALPASPPIQFQAKDVDRMVTEFSMSLVMNGCSGKSIRGVTAAPDMPENSSRRENALRYGRDVLKKLFHSQLLYHSDFSGNRLVTSIIDNKWRLSFQEDKKILFSCTLPLSAAPSPASLP